MLLRVYSCRAFVEREGGREAGRGADAASSLPSLLPFLGGHNHGDRDGWPPQATACPSFPGRTGLDASGAPALIASPVLSTQKSNPAAVDLSCLVLTGGTGGAAAS